MFLSATPKDGKSEGNPAVYASTTLHLLVGILAILSLAGGVVWTMTTLGKMFASGTETSMDRMPGKMLPGDKDRSAERSGTFIPAEQKSTSDLNAEDLLLKEAQQRVRSTFPEYSLQVVTMRVFLALVHTPWQEPDSVTMRRLREEAKKRWGRDYKHHLQTVMNTLRDIAVGLLADYLKMEDRGAYLAGELLRIEMMSEPKAIRISVFLGEKSDGSVSSRLEADWYKGLRTVEQLPAKWPEMFPDETMPPVEIVACRPPADFDITQFRFLRGATQSSLQTSRRSRKRYTSVKQQWMTAKSWGMPLLGIRNVGGRSASSSEDRMLLALFKLTSPPRITVDYLPHRHRQADILGWSQSGASSRLMRASCFTHVARACAVYTKDRVLDILDLGPCVPVIQSVSAGNDSVFGSVHFAFAKTHVAILRISLEGINGSKELSEGAGAATDAERLAITLCQQEKRFTPMLTGPHLSWLILHVRATQQKSEFRNVLEGCLFAENTSRRKAEDILTLMSRTCTTSDNSVGSTRIWSDAEIEELRKAVWFTFN